MTSQTTGRTDAAGRDGNRENSQVSKPDQAGALTSSHGQTTIADTVVQRIATMAAREVPGVRELGGGLGRAVGAIRERIPGAQSSTGQGVAVEVGERQAAVDLELLVDYGVAIPDLARAVRKNVMAGIERMTGLEVVEVNINVNDVYLGDEDDDSAQDRPARVE